MTKVLPIMKFAISISDKLFEQADTLAHERKISRSALYAAAMEKYLRACEDERITEALNKAYDNVDSKLEPDVVALQAASIRLYDEW